MIISPCEQDIVYQTDYQGCWDTDEMVFPVSQQGIRLWLAQSVHPLLTAKRKDLNKGVWREISWTSIPDSFWLQHVELL